MIFEGTRTPAVDFTSPVIAGWNDEIAGSEVTHADADKAKDLWAQADAIAPWSGTFTIAYNADGGHQPWVDAVTNQLKNTLGIDAAGQSFPDLATLREEIKKPFAERGDAFGMAVRLPGCVQHPGRAVHHRCRFQRRRLLEPRVRRARAEGLHGAVARRGQQALRAGAGGPVHGPSRPAALVPLDQRRFLHARRQPSSTAGTAGRSCTRSPRPASNTPALI